MLDLLVQFMMLTQVLFLYVVVTLIRLMLLTTEPILLGLVILQLELEHIDSFLIINLQEQKEVQDWNRLLDLVLLQ